jgi:heptosyltransferase-3
MKILVIQLARFGDILQTEPTLIALKEKFPEGQIHLLVRAKYLEAAVFCTADKVISMDTADILSPLLGFGNFPEWNSDLHGSISRVTEFSDSLLREEYDQIINLSFSPSSSYLSYAITAKTSSVVKGYSRHSDGYLSIPDDASAYFYAQVGIKKYNRIHITDLFATVAEVQLTQKIWEQHVLPVKRKKSVVVHIGASSQKKTLTKEKWNSVLNCLASRAEESGLTEVILIGSKDEVSTAQYLTENRPGSFVKSFVGQTSIEQTISLMHQAGLLVGCDSAPMHMAALVNLPTLCLSRPNVNFWETGPKSVGSRIWFADSEEDFPAEWIASECVAILNNGPSLHAQYSVNSNREIVSFHNGPASDLRVHDSKFASELLAGLYLEGEFPEVRDALTITALENAMEIIEMVEQQLERIGSAHFDPVHSKIIEKGDELLRLVGHFVPELMILITWYETEKIRMAPGSVETVKVETTRIVEQLKNIVKLLLMTSGKSEEPTKQNTMRSEYGT